MTPLCIWLWLTKVMLPSYKRISNFLKNGKIDHRCLSTWTSVMCYELHGAGTPMITSCTTRSLSVICITGKNNGFPFLDILGYLKNTHKNPNFGKVRQVQPENSQPSSLIGTCLTLPNLGFLWVFFKYPKVSKNGNLLFFPVYNV